MIEKIIIQDSSEVHSIWIPERRSLASFVVWKAFGLGHCGQWVDGRITLGTRTDWSDRPSFPEFPGYQDVAFFPAWVGHHLAAVDAALPCPTDIAAALDPDSLTVMLDPPAYRVPWSPVADDLASCLLAARILLSVKDSLIGPTDMSSAELVSELEYASRIAALVGSEDSRRIALESAASLDLCLIIPDGETPNDTIMQEKADD